MTETEFHETCDEARAMGREHAAKGEPLDATHYDGRGSAAFNGHYAQGWHDWHEENEEN